MKFCIHIYNNIYATNSSSYDNSVDLYTIGESTSRFGKNAEEFLNINIVETDDFNDILPEFPYDISHTSQELKNLYMEDEGLIVFDTNLLYTSRIPRKYKLFCIV
jgi:hypothetical protein